MVMRGQHRPLNAGALVIQLGLTLLLGVVAPVILGFWLDHLLRTSPYLTLFLTVIGTTSGSIILMYTISGVYKRVEGDKT
jgi:F0F1-type ATP synthase assembly protein I